MSKLLFTSLFTMTDEQAMWRVQTQGDAVAFNQLMQRWEGPIQRLCIRMTGDVHRGEDLAQETFARLFAKRAQFQPNGKFSTYLWRIALNLCYDEFRSRQRRSECSLDEDNNGQPLDTAEALNASPDESLAQSERAEIVRAALMRLPENYRTVLILRHYENLKFREIADVLEIPEGTVKSRMAEAIVQLTRVLQPFAGEIKETISTASNQPSERILI